METKPVLGVVLRGGPQDRSKLTAHYLAELRRVGRHRGYARVAREVYRNLESMIAVAPSTAASPFRSRSCTAITTGHSCRSATPTSPRFEARDRFHRATRGIS